MYTLEKNISGSYEELVEAFNHIIELINDNELEKAASLLDKMHYADLVDFLDYTTSKIHRKILPVLADSIKPETLIWLSDNAKHSVVEILGVDKIATLLNQLPIEDTIEVIEHIDEGLKKQIINNFAKDKQQQIIEGFTYPEDTVGRIIEKNFIALQENWNVEQALAFIKNDAPSNDFHAAIIVDSKSRPTGNILLSHLLRCPNDALLHEVMNHELRIADPFTNLDEIAFIFKKYVLTIVPVVNKSGKLIGSVSIDNMIYIVEQQTEKDIMQLGGLHTQDLFLNIFHTAWYRFPWLFINLITAFMTSAIIDRFSLIIEKLVAVAVMMPIVASVGGNAGTQAMTVTVRALAHKDIHHTNILRVIIKETVVSGLNGLILANVSAGICFVVFANFRLSLIFGGAVLINFITAGLFGAVIPIILDKVEIDPATASGVFLTALTDASGFCTFLTLAYLFLN